MQYKLLIYCLFFILSQISAKTYLIQQDYFNKVCSLIEGGKFLNGDWEKNNPTYFYDRDCLFPLYNSDPQQIIREIISPNGFEEISIYKNPIMSYCQKKMYRYHFNAKISAMNKKMKEDGYGDNSYDFLKRYEESEKYVPADFWAVFNPILSEIGYQMLISNKDPRVAYENVLNDLFEEYELSKKNDTDKINDTII